MDKSAEVLHNIYVEINSSLRNLSGISRKALLKVSKNKRRDRRIKSDGKGSDADLKGTDEEVRKEMDLEGISLEKGATAMERNNQIGGHKA